MIDERSHPAGVAGSHQARMPEPTPEPRDLLLEAGGVNGERQRAGQHLHQEAAAGRLFERHEHAAIADGSHLALHPVSGLERVPQCRAEISHERDRKSTRLNSSHGYISYAVFCLKKKKTTLASYLQDDVC